MERIDDDRFANSGFLEVETKYTTCESCKEVFEEEEMVSLAEFDICKKCKEDISKAIFKMISGYAAEHKCNIPKAKELIFEVIAEEF